MKNLVFLLLCIGSTFIINAQQTISTSHTGNVFRINFINPGVELEVSTGNDSTFSTGLGVGYGGSYPDLDESVGSGWIYIIAPFLDLQQKWFYNFDERINKDKTVAHNSGNFVSARLLTRGKSIADNIRRTSNVDFAVGPTWGIQRKYGSFHFLFDVGTIYYFDTKGNGNWFPVMFQINLGLDL